MAQVLPLSFVMIAGPQIITSFFFATSESWKSISAAYVLGALISMSIVVTFAYLIVGEGEGGEDTGLSTVDWVVVGLLAVAALHTFRSRHDTEPPKWMGKLESATPKSAFVLGFLLLGFFPSDLVTSVAVGCHLADDGHPLTHAIPFIFLATLLLASPAIAVALLGRRADAILPKVRNWMNTNSWIVSEVVIVFFIIIILST